MSADGRETWVNPYVYFAIISSNDSPGKVKIIQMQDFNEPDYDPDRFITSKRFKTIQDAKNYIVENYDYIKKITDLLEVYK